MDNLLNEDLHFSTDSREIREGSIFIALQGNRNGNDFAEEALKKGASKVILSQTPAFAASKEKYIVVEDTLKALQHLAAEKIKILKKLGVKIVALTGSCGKTTVKDLILHLLNSAEKKAYGSPESFNNHIGLPLTILNAPYSTEYLVLEMGMNHKNELSQLIKIAPADVRIILNITSAHIGNFSEGLKGIAKAKMEILEGSTKNTKFITQKDLPFYAENIINFAGEISFISLPSNVRYINGRTLFTCYDKQYYFNKIVTPKWLECASFGIQALRSLNIDSNYDFSGFILPNGRGNEIKISNNITLLDESYNANLSSTLNAIETLSLLPHTKLLVLGEMKELGDQSLSTHLEVIKAAANLKQTTIIFVGEEFKRALHLAKENIHYFASVEDLIENFDMDATIAHYNYIMAKSSKSSFISKFVKEILKKYGKI